MPSTRRAEPIRILEASLDDLVAKLPHWDLDPIYPGLDSAAFTDSVQSLRAAIGSLTDLIDRLALGRDLPDLLGESTVCTFEMLLDHYNAALEVLQQIAGYLECLSSSDVGDERLEAATSTLNHSAVELSILETRLTMKIGELDIEGLINNSRVAQDHTFILRRAQTYAQHLMSPETEGMVAELSITGGRAWVSLYEKLTARLQVPIDSNGALRELPMSAATNLARDPDREVRRQAHERRNAVWSTHALPLAMALTSIKGEAEVLTRRRGWRSSLEAALFDNQVDCHTLEIMLAAVDEARPDFQRYLRAKAQVLGLPVLAGYDLFAPIGTQSRSWSFPETAEFICQQFGSFSPELRAVAERAFHERWIDAEPRPGKAGGAFCVDLGHGLSRLLINYTPAFGSLCTLAHELGHAYHNSVRARRSMLQRSTPPTLTETASIFCEMIVQEAALRQAEPREQLTFVEASLQTACLLVIDATVAFLFEQELCERRQDHELAAGEMTELTLELQRRMYGDSIDGQTLFPYLWAELPQLYTASFYSFQYTFGFLFGIGLYGRYRDNPEHFTREFEDLLAATGMSTATDLATAFAIDLHAPEFWRSSLDVIRARIDQFEQLVEVTAPRNGDQLWRGAKGGQMELEQ